MGFRENWARPHNPGNPGDPRQARAASWEGLLPRADRRSLRAETETREPGSALSVHRGGKSGARTEGELGGGVSARSPPAGERPGPGLCSHSAAHADEQTGSSARRDRCWRCRLRCAHERLRVLLGDTCTRGNSRKTGTKDPGAQSPTAAAPGEGKWDGEPGDSNLPATVHFLYKKNSKPNDNL